MTVDEFGYFYVADWGNERVQIFDNHGDFLQLLRGEATLSKWAQSFMESNVDERDTRKNANLEPVAGIDFSDTGDPHRESAYVEKLFWGIFLNNFSTVHKYNRIRNGRSKSHFMSHN